MNELCYETIQFSPFLVAEQVADLPSQIEAAASAGFPWIGIDHASVGQFVDGGRRLEELAALLREHALRCFELQALSIGEDEAQTLRDAEQLAELVELLQPPWVQCGVTTEPSSRVCANFHKAAGLLRDAGASLAVEFLPFLAVNDIASTRELIARAEVPDAKIVVDTWHFFHGPDDWAQLEAVSLEELAYPQFNDHPVLESDDLYDETIHRRVLPGNGRFELERFCACFRAKGYTGPVSLEILSQPMRSWSKRKFARAVYEASAAFWS